MKKKILAILVMTIVMFATLTNAYAKEGMFDFGVFDTAYRLSKEENIELPFLNFFEKSATYDKEEEIQQGSKVSGLGNLLDAGPIHREKEWSK